MCLPTLTARSPLILHAARFPISLFSGFLKDSHGQACDILFLPASSDSLRVHADEEIQPLKAVNQLLAEK